jgi:tetraprenyl-beta-curcumene synthase
MRGPVVQPFHAFTDGYAHNDSAHASGRSRSTLTLAAVPVPRGSGRHGNNLRLRLALGSTVARYLTSIFPLMRRELAHWQAHALEIPDPVLRSHAIEGLSKRGNLEGAALFAMLSPRSERTAMVQALVAFQAAYNYLDTLSEQPSADPIANSRQLHQALLRALDPSATHADYYALHPHSEDGGFLVSIVETCRTALATLPSYATVAAPASSAAARIVAFQSLNLTEHQGGHHALERWARGQAAEAPGLDWWQMAGAAGSSLAVYALVAAAADPDMRIQDVEAIESAYFPWICALHSLLDSLVDVAEDEQAGQRNLLSYHASTGQAACAMGTLAQQATEMVRNLPNELHHRVILSAMVGYYLSSPDASSPYARAIAGSVVEAIGPLLSPALGLFRVRRVLTRSAGGGRW